ncbi:hypothetical protein GCM10011583_46180 [Streptomyces camponoticapitis]|uniref:Uncharacterized protein n=1 Tax=Streptomyces camponoticapitis TaxID=1616125 RepID=A0ABQ2EFF1_9ACTN|nr:hypothetical protein [Streptomyces camponoticapitis]GGK08867.1 hypothetical protein GCM10011583_46180 [Streptomyces camponoticapitis]
MERIDPIIQPVPAAGTDPGYIPGLMAPRLVEEADDAAKDVPPGATDEETAEEPTEGAEASRAATADESGPTDVEADSTSDAGTGDKADDADDANGAVSFKKDASDDDADEDGPVFDVSDRRASMTADRTGVRLRLDETEAEFGWDEIGAVEIETPRFTRRFTVTLHTTGRRHYQSEVDAPSRSSLKKWTADLDAVLDAYFEEA